MKNKIILCIFSMLISSFVFSQKIITGNVSGANGIGPLPGATIMVKNSTNSVNSDFEGNYSINAKTGDVLVFSFLGMILVNNQSTINVVLKEDSAQLDEVVVIGYGTSTKESLNGAVEVVKAEKFAMATTTSLESSLQGNV